MIIKHRYTYDVIFNGPNLRDADLREANLREANLREANLREANLREANLREADLYGANLRGADLYGANLRVADLREANLRGADLYGANLRGADLYGADLRGADLRGADLRGAKYSIFQVLRSRFGLLSDDLTRECMRWDAVSCGEEKMLAWASGGPCPFSESDRELFFTEKRSLWIPGSPLKNHRELWESLAAEGNIRIGGVDE